MNKLLTKSIIILTIIGLIILVSLRKEEALTSKLYHEGAKETKSNSLALNHEYTYPKNYYHEIYQGQISRDDETLSHNEELYANGYKEIAKHNLEKLISNSIVMLEYIDIEYLQLLRTIYLDDNNLDVYDNLIKIIPDSHPAKIDILRESAAFYFQQNLGNKSKELLNMAINLNGDDYYLRNSLADINMLEGNYEIAQNELMKSLDIAENPYAYYELGKCYLLMGQEGPAQEEFAKAVELSQDYASEIPKAYDYVRAIKTIGSFK